MSFVLNRVCKNSFLLLGRSIYTSPPVQNEIKKWSFNMAGYNKYGLLSDDLLDEANPDVAEAVRRLPEDLKMQRSYRAIRAFQAEVNHSLLPEDQWTKIEDNHFYLQPYLQEVKAEREEREQWEANH